MNKGTYYIKIGTDGSKGYGEFRFEPSFESKSFAKGNLKYSIKSKNTVSVSGMINKTKSSVTIPNTVKIDGKKYKVTGISNNAFKNNSSLKKITLGSNVEKIGKNTFYGCKNLTNITIKTSKLNSKNIGAKAFYKAGSKNYKKLVVKVPSKKVKSYRAAFRNRGLSSKVSVRK